MKSRKHRILALTAALALLLALLPQAGASSLPTYSVTVWAVEYPSGRILSRMTITYDSPGTYTVHAPDAPEGYVLSGPSTTRVTVGGAESTMSTVEFYFTLGGAVSTPTPTPTPMQPSLPTAIPASDPLNSLPILAAAGTSRLIFNGTLAVYTGPASDRTYYRSASGKAAVDQSDVLTVYGRDGDFLLFQYTVTNMVETTRFGYARTANFVNGSSYPALTWGQVNVSIDEAAQLIDEPSQRRQQAAAGYGSVTFSRVKATALAQCWVNGEQWIYVETTGTGGAGDNPGQFKIRGFVLRQYVRVSGRSGPTAAPAQPTAVPFVPPQNTVAPAYWATRFTGGGHGQNLSSSLYRLSDGNRYTNVHYTLWNSEYKDGIPQFTAYFSNSTVSSIGIINGDSEDYYGNARLRVVRLVVNTAYGRSPEIEINIPDTAGSDYQMFSLGSTYTNVQSIEIHVWGIQSGTRDKYNVCISDICFTP